MYVSQNIVQAEYALLYFIIKLIFVYVFLLLYIIFLLFYFNLTT